MKVTLTLIDNEIKEFNLSKNVLTLGRSKSNDISIPHEGLSRVHCRIELNDQGEIVVTDLNSTNGILIQGNKIPAEVPTLYPPFLTITIGPIVGLSVQANVETIKPQVPLKMKEGTKKTVLREKGSKNEKKSGLPEKDFKKYLKPLLILIVILTALYFINQYTGSDKDQFELPPSPKNLNL